MLNLPLPKRFLSSTPTTPGDLVSRYAADLEKTLPPDNPPNQLAGSTITHIQILTADGTVVASLPFSSGPITVAPGVELTIPGITIVA